MASQGSISEYQRYEYVICQKGLYSCDMAMDSGRGVICIIYRAIYSDKNPGKGERGL